jgi:hypothetical protein
MKTLVLGLFAALWLIWSAVAWSAHAVATWAGSLTPDIAAWTELGQYQPPAWLQALTPQFVVDAIKAGVAQWGPWLHQTVLAFPDLFALFGAAIWMTWGFGTAILAVAFFGFWWYARDSGRAVPSDGHVWGN